MKSTKRHIDDVAGIGPQGLICSVGSDAYQRGSGQSMWQFGLPDGVKTVDGRLVGETPAASPDGRHWACVAVGPNGARHVAVATMGSPHLHVYAPLFTAVHGMSWSPDGSLLCVVAPDPRVGVISMGPAALSSLSTCSLFVGVADADDLVSFAGPVALPGAPRWSPACDAVAVVGLERGGDQSVAVVTLSGLEGSMVTGVRVVLGSSGWTPDGHLLCAVQERYDGTRVCLVDTSDGNASWLAGEWQEVLMLTLADDGSVIVAGRRDGVWCIARVTDTLVAVLTPPFWAMSEAAVAGGICWFVARVDDAHMGLWASDLGTHETHVRLAASSMRDLRVRPSGLAAAVKAGETGQETVCVALGEGDTIDELGRRDMIWGWPDARPVTARRPKLHYLLTPVYDELVRDQDAAFAGLEADEGPARPLWRRRPPPGNEPGEGVPVSGDVSGIESASAVALPQLPMPRSAFWWVWVALIVVLVILVGILAAFSLTPLRSWLAPTTRYWARPRLDRRAESWRDRPPSGRPRGGGFAG